MLASTDAEAIASIKVAIARSRPPQLCAAQDVDFDPADADSIKAAIVASQLCPSRDERSARLRILAEALEPLCEVDRVGTSPLVDGYWELLHATSPPAWWPRNGRIRHVIESAAPLGADIATPQRSTSPGAPGLRTGPRGGEWDDVCLGRGAYVQRCRRSLLMTSELRATYTWLGGEAWDLCFEERKQLLFGILPVWRSRSSTLNSSFDLDHALRPTYVDGEILILRAPRVTVGADVLRGDRLYMLRRMRNRLWQDNDFTGLSDRWEARWEP